MTFLTLGEAEREVGVTKSTISRAIKDGRLSPLVMSMGIFRLIQLSCSEYMNQSNVTMPRSRAQPLSATPRNPMRNTTQHRHLTSMSTI